MHLLFLLLTNNTQAHLPQQQTITACYAPIENHGTWQGYIWTNNPWDQSFWFGGVPYASTVGVNQACNSVLVRNPGATVELNGIDGQGRYFVRACDTVPFVARSHDGQKCLYASMSINGILLGADDFSANSYDMTYTFGY